jgi:AcrR family transcriptional regulator
MPDMATQTEPSRERRAPLSRERVLETAVDIADEGGIDALTMRHLAEALGVEAMSLYYHVANKEAVLDGIVDVIVDEINQAVSQVDRPTAEDDWKVAMRTRILTARDVLLEHRWAPEVMESRTKVSPGVIGYFDGLLGIFRGGGFSYDLAHHALHALGSRALGFTQELFEPEDDSGDEESMEMLEQMADQFPYLVGMLAEVVHDDPSSTLGWCDDQVEFEFGLDLILDGLDRLRTGT